MRERGTAGPAGNAVGRGTMNSRFEAVIHPKRSVMFTVKRGRRADTANDRVCPVADFSPWELHRVG
jgi:hypothetical protein